MVKSSITEEVFSILPSFLNGLIQILVPNTAIIPRKSTLLSITEYYLPGAVITQVPRRYYNEQMGHDYIQQLAFSDDIAGLKVAVSAKFYAISAAAAALKHVELSYTRFALNSLRIKYQGSEGSICWQS